MKETQLLRRSKPRPQDFSDDETYLEALEYWKLRQGRILSLFEGPPDQSPSRVVVR